MRVSLLSSTLIMAMSFSALVHADGVVNQRRPAPQQDQQYQDQEPQYQEPQYEEPQDQGYYDDEESYSQSNVQVNNLIIQNPGYQGPVIYPQGPCIMCVIETFGDVARIIAVGPNGYGEIVFYGYQHPLAPGRPPEIVLAVSDLQARGFCRNLIPIRPACAPGLVCGGGPIAQPLPYPPVAAPYPGPRPGPGIYPPRRPGPRPFPRPVPYRRR